MASFGIRHWQRISGAKLLAFLLIGAGLGLLVTSEFVLHCGEKIGLAIGIALVLVGTFWFLKTKIEQHPPQDHGRAQKPR